NDCALEAPWRDLTSLPPDKDIHLWSGLMRIDTPTGSFTGPSQVRLAWRRSPSIIYRIASNDTGVAAAAMFGGHQRMPVPLVKGVPSVVPGRRAWRGAEPGKQYTVRTGGHLDRQTFIADRSIDSLTVGLINFDKALRLRWAQLEGDEESRPYLPLDVAPWKLSLIGRPGTDAWRQQIRDSRGFLFTHALRIERQDGAKFEIEDADLLLEAVFHVFSFANGALVGQALPMGYRGGQVVAITWGCTIVDGWADALSWYDYSNADDLPTLLAGYLARAADPYWRKVLQRATRMLLAANTADPVDAAVPIALSALELLAWATGESGGDEPAAAQIRALLQWANIPLAVPTQLEALERYRAERSTNLVDVADAIASVRNRAVHPPRGSEAEWPATAVLIDTWRAALEFGELALLKLLGHRGNYGHRRHMTGRWVGDTDVVPWAEDEARSQPT
ncbi:MAG: hypothetical protein ABL982_23110, partial [Vicinamibacterales bacterium]